MTTSLLCLMWPNSTWRPRLGKLQICMQRWGWNGNVCILRTTILICFKGQLNCKHFIFFSDLPKHKDCPRQAKKSLWDPQREECEVLPLPNWGWGPKSQQKKERPKRRTTRKQLVWALCRSLHFREGCSNAVKHNSGAWQHRKPWMSMGVWG